MSRPRPSSKKRRRAHAERKRLREILAKRQQSSAQNTPAAPAPSSTTPSGSNPSGSNENCPAPKVVKPGYKRRHLPDRLYFARENKYDLRFMAFQRRSTELIDNKISETTKVIDNSIAEMTKVLDERTSFFSDNFKHYQELSSKNNERTRGEVASEVKRIEGSLAKLLQRVNHLETRCNELSLELMRERQHRRVASMRSHTGGNVDNAD